MSKGTKLITSPQEDARGYFSGVPSENIAQYWDELSELLEKPLAKTNSAKYYTPDDILWKCVQGDWQCWIAWADKIDAVFTTYVSTYPTGHKTFTINFVGGVKMTEWLPTAWNTLKAFAKENGCSEMVGMGRKGWLRSIDKVEDSKFEEKLTFSVEI